jgi:hypothetical protein
MQGNSTVIFLNDILFYLYIQEIGFYGAKSCQIYISCDITLFVNCQQGALKNHCQENLPARKDTFYEVIC